MRKVFYIGLCLALLHILSTDASAVQHIVKKGESLYRIAKTYGVSVKQLKKANNLSGSIIHQGDAIIIPTKSSSNIPPTASDTNQSAGHLTTHVVESGETLYRIALKFGISVGELKRINNLSKNTLMIGQALLVPSVETEEELPDAIEEVGGGENALVMNETRAAEENPKEEHSNELAQNSTYNDTSENKTEAGERDQNESSLMEVAMDYMGVPYRFGGSTLRGIDCSAFVQRVFRYFSIDLPRTAREQFKAGVKISKRELRIGDLLFFKTYARYPSHVGIYIGEGKMIHASSRSKKVTVSSINDPYYVRRYIGAVRLPEDPSRISVEGIPSITAN